MDHCSIAASTLEGRPADTKAAMELKTLQSCDRLRSFVRAVSRWACSNPDNFSEFWMEAARFPNWSTICDVEAAVTFL
jgi:hypothetical protein